MVQMCWLLVVTSKLPLVRDGTLGGIGPQPVQINILFPLRISLIIPVGFALHSTAEDRMLASYVFPQNTKIGNSLSSHLSL